MTDDPLVGYYKLQLATISNQSVRKSGSPLLNIFEALFFVLSVSDTINLKRLRPAITKVPSFYLTGDRYLSVLHARIRNKCSNLNNDLFNNHLSPTPYATDVKKQKTLNIFLHLSKFHRTSNHDVSFNMVIPST